MKHLFILFSLVLTCNYCSAQIPSYVDTNGLLAWYPFDSSLNNAYGGPVNDGVPYGSIGYGTDRYGVANHSYKADAQGLVNIPVHDFPLGNAARSVCVYFRLDSLYPGGTRSLFGWGGNSFGNRFNSCTTDTAIGVEYVNGNVVTHYTPDTFWHNLIITYPPAGIGSSSVNIYFDGVLKPSPSIYLPITSFNTDTGTWHSIGGSLYFGTAFTDSWLGYIDDIGVWNRVLTACEVEHLYNSGPVYPSITATGTTLAASSSYLTYQWLSGSTVIAGATSATYHARSNGAYTLVVTDSSGCSDTSHAITVSDAFVNNVYAGSGEVIVYPNPSASVVFIQSSMNLNATLVNALGAVVLQKNDAKELSLANLPAGLYFVKLFDADGKLVHYDKVIKQ